MAELNFNRAPNPVQQPGQATVDSGGFWPVVDLNDLRAAMRVDNTITSERLYYAAVGAAAYVNDQLAALEADAAEAGYQGLAAARPGQIINGEPAAVMRYRRAVYSYTKAALLEAYADYDAAGKTAARAEAKQDQAEDYRREGHHAVADLLGRCRVDSELV